MSEKLRHIFTIEKLPRRVPSGDVANAAASKVVSIPRVDVLLFVAPELDPTAHYLGHSRLAPVQIGMSAGTGTSGLGGAVGQLDYFVTGDALHQEEAHRSYTEQMVRLPHAGTILPTKVAGLPESVKIGSPLQYMFKYRYQQSTLYLYARHQYVVVLHDEMEQIHEQFDQVLTQLLWNHEELHILFVGTDRWNGWDENPLGYSRLVSRVRRRIDRFEPMNVKKDKKKKNEEEENEEEENEEEEEEDNHEGEDDGEEGKREKPRSSWGSSNTRGSEDDKARVKRRVRHITGLSRADYLSLLAAVNVVLDPMTEDGGGAERVLLPALDVMLIGTPLVTLHPDVHERGWDRVRPTSSVAALLSAVDGGESAGESVGESAGESAGESSETRDNDESSRGVLWTTCVGKTVNEYIERVSSLLLDTTLQRKVRARSRKRTKPWIEMQNQQVKKAWYNFLERVGRPYANWRVSGT